MLKTQMSEIDECSRPRLRSRVKTDRPSASSTISSSDSLETRPVCEDSDRLLWLVLTCTLISKLHGSHSALVPLVIASSSPVGSQEAESRTSNCIQR